MPTVNLLAVGEGGIHGILISCSSSIISFSYLLPGMVLKFFLFLKLRRSGILHNKNF